MSTSTTSFEAFRLQALMEGYDEALERDWAPLTLVDMHSHPFDAKAIVTRGEMWLTVGDLTRQLRPGDTFEIERNVLHAERYGTQGATYWVARRAGG
ncbi:AraC family transcriptional regulator [Hydrogenophaga sp.]|uniref:cupin domain-containing protein n=1 Tax=Hydrogenophaga sp. TaxID=1904254 RepID=UPI002612BBA1|nr:AraC family transcriptional regulator [Hydrogenophaga sp.]MCW5652928.1 AraC family transcriptional regulator [Hydrogenophaga sp.]